MLAMTRKILQWLQGNDSMKLSYKPWITPMAMAVVSSRSPVYRRQRYNTCMVNKISLKDVNKGERKGIDYSNNGDAATVYRG